MTKGEKSSNGSVRRRTSESDKASEIMGLHTRINLEIDDTKINHLSEEQLVKVINVIRRYQPTIILAPYYEDLNPDHREASLLIKDGIFKAGLNRIGDTREALPPHKCSQVFYYPTNMHSVPSIIFDISDVYSKKNRSS